MGFLNTTKIIFLHFWILQHVCKTPKGIGQYSKKYKNLIFGGIHLLFTANVWIKKSKIIIGNIQNIIGNNLLLFTINIWIKKPGVVNIQNNFLRIINLHTSLKEALIIIEDISIFFTPRFTSRESIKH
jgi:hypothetical protein